MTEIYDNSTQGDDAQSVDFDRLLAEAQPSRPPSKKELKLRRGEESTREVDIGRTRAMAHASDLLETGRTGLEQRIEDARKRVADLMAEAETSGMTPAVNDEIVELIDEKSVNERSAKEEAALVRIAAEAAGRRYDESTSKKKPKHRRGLFGR